VRTGGGRAAIFASAPLVGKPGIWTSELGGLICSYDSLRLGDVNKQRLVRRGLSLIDQRGGGGDGRPTRLLSASVKMEFDGQRESPRSVAGRGEAFT
jgi:hypothetical protein